MKKTLLLAACTLMLGSALTMQAENKVYTYSDGGALYLGMLNRVSDNGRWAVGTDDGYQTGSYIIDTNAPEEIIDVNDGELYDIANDGMAVGAWYENLGTPEEPVNSQHAAYYKNGEWIRLSEPLNSMGRSFARSVSGDGRYIAGMTFCAASNSEVGATYYPCLWTLNDETGDYDLKCYNNLKLPGNMGFTVNDMTDDGRTIVGSLFTDWGGLVPALVKDGELTVWNKMEWREEWPFLMPDGETHYYSAGFVDDVLEGNPDEFYGGLNYIHGNYAFGHRTIAIDVNAEAGTGTLIHNRSIYNLETGEFVDEPSESVFSCGFDATRGFMTSNADLKAYYLNDGAMRRVNRQFGIQADFDIAAVYGTDKAGRVFACSAVYFEESMGMYFEFPVLMILDEPVVGIQSVHEELRKQLAGKTFDLSGRVNPQGRGIRITNGQKVLKK